MTCRPRYRSALITAKGPSVCGRVVFPDPVSPRRIRNAPRSDDAVSSRNSSNFRGPASTGVIRDLRSWPLSIFSTLSNRIGTLGLGIVTSVVPQSRESTRRGSPAAHGVMREGRVLMITRSQLRDHCNRSWPWIETARRDPGPPRGRRVAPAMGNRSARVIPIVKTGGIASGLQELQAGARKKRDAA